MSVAQFLCAAAQLPDVLHTNPCTAYVLHLFRLRASRLPSLWCCCFCITAYPPQVWRLRQLHAAVHLRAAHGAVPDGRAAASRAGPGPGGAAGSAPPGAAAAGLGTVAAWLGGGPGGRGEI